MRELPPVLSGDALQQIASLRDYLVRAARGSESETLETVTAHASGILKQAGRAGGPAALPAGENQASDVLQREARLRAREEERRRREEAEKENRRRKEAEQLAAKLNNKIESAAAGLSAQIAAANGELLVQLQNMPPQKYKVPYNDPNRTMPIETAEETASREPETPSKLFTYSFVNGSVTISSYSGAADTVVIPRYIEGKPVTVISNRAFYTNTKLRRVVISDKLERIFPDAFKNCRNLEELVIPPNAGLSNIGDNAFEHCVSLKKVTFPESLERIGRWAFGQCIGLETVVIPNAISSIGFGAFSECPGLKNLYITENAQNRLSRLDLIVDNLNVVRIIQPNGL